MSDQPEPAKRRWISLGEFIAMAALAISGLGLWNSWQDGKKEPTEIVERRLSVPLALIGRVEDGGRRLVIQPVDNGHALDSLTIVLPSGTFETGPDGEIDSGSITDAIGDTNRSGSGSVKAMIEARYIEAGKERVEKKPYLLRYRWEGGGLFEGKRLRLTGLRRA